MIEDIILGIVVMTILIIAFICYDRKAHEYDWEELKRKILG
mgnify:CR=1 FL=1